MAYKVVDSNGEIVGYIEEGDRIIKAGSVESVRGTVSWNPEESFGKFYPEAMKKLSKFNCTASEYRLLFLAKKKILRQHKSDGLVVMVSACQLMLLC